MYAKRMLLEISQPLIYDSPLYIKGFLLYEIKRVIKEPLDQSEWEMGPTIEQPKQPATRP